MKGLIMGSNFANDLASMESLTLDQAVSIHLSANHYPPVPTSMVQPCVDAIYAVNDWQSDKEIDLPEGITYKGAISAPAWAIVEQHHLDAWVSIDE